MAHTQTQDPAAGGAGALPAGMTMQQLYDALMSQVEPELTSDTIPRLDKLYADETPEQRKKRAQRYVRAFETIDMVFNALIGISNQEMQDYKEQVLGKFRKKEGKKDAKHLSDIDRAIDAA